MPCNLVQIRSEFGHASPVGIARHKLAVTPPSVDPTHHFFEFVIPSTCFRHSVFLFQIFHSNLADKFFCSNLADNFTAQIPTLKYLGFHQALGN